MIRVLKFTQPPERTAEIVPSPPDMPVEGGLLPSAKPGEKWSYNVDEMISHRSQIAKVLAVLFENEGRGQD